MQPNRFIPQVSALQFLAFVSHRRWFFVLFFGLMFFNIQLTKMIRVFLVAAKSDGWYFAVIKIGHKACRNQRNTTYSISDKKCEKMNYLKFTTIFEYIRPWNTVENVKFKLYCKRSNLCTIILLTIAINGAMQRSWEYLCNTFFFFCFCFLTI